MIYNVSDDTSVLLIDGGSFVCKRAQLVCAHARLKAPEEKLLRKPSDTEVFFVRSKFSVNTG